MPLGQIGCHAIDRVAMCDTRVTGCEQTSVNSVSILKKSFLSHDTIFRARIWFVYPSWSESCAHQKKSA